MLKGILLISLVMITLIGCASKGDIIEDVETHNKAVFVKKEPIAFKRLKSQPYSFEYNSGFVKKERLIIKNLNSFQEIWEKVYSNHFPKPELPKIDFERSIVLLASLGMKTSGGYTILIKEVNSVGGHIEVIVYSDSPGRGCMTTQSLTYPVDIAVIDNVSSDIRFIEVNEIDNCM